MTPSTEDKARRDPLSHSVDAEGRFWDHGGAPSLGAYLRAAVHAMPHPPGECSLHELLDALGSPALFQWANGIWHVAGDARMSRLAYSPAWLASRGWRYARAVVATNAPVVLDPASDPIVTDVTIETDDDAAPAKSTRAKKD